MADVIACIISHCEADGTLTALVPAAKIVRNIRSSTALPQLYFAVRGGEPTSPGTGTKRISILCRAESPATCISVLDRVRQLFHEKTNYTLGASPNTVKCVISQQASDADEVEYIEPACVEWQVFYDFTVVQPHGF